MITIWDSQRGNVRYDIVLLIPLQSDTSIFSVLNMLEHKRYFSQIAVYQILQKMSNDITIRFQFSLKTQKIIPRPVVPRVGNKSNGMIINNISTAIWHNDKDLKHNF